MTEINLFPKFLDSALTPVATSVGNTLSSVWTIVFGNVDSYAQKLEYKRTQELDKFKDELDTKVASIPKEKLVEPPLHILGPTLDASKFYFENEELRTMFANLIAASINIDNTNYAHPAFVEIIKQLHPDEAKIIRALSDIRFPLLDVHIQFENKTFLPILQNFSDIAEQTGCNIPSSVSSYLINLSRLGLISIGESQIATEGSYDSLLNHPVIIEAKQRSLLIGEKEPIIIKKHFRTTPFGLQFYRTCCVEFRHTVIPPAENQ